MPFYIMRSGADGKPQYAEIVDGVFTWTPDKDQMTVWNQRQKAENIIASQTASGVIKDIDKAVARERPDQPGGETS
jgi:hypothetical protein